MADTDSALKTQMYMSESSRQNAMDLTNRISQGFQAASEAVKFESQVSQAMVKSAADFKQLQVDEWYKKEQVAMEARRINLAEKTAIARINNEKARIDAQNSRADSVLKRQQAADTEKQENERYKVVAAEVDSTIQGLKAKSDNINIEAKKISGEIANLDAQGQLLEPQVLAGEVSVEYAEKYGLELQKNKQKLGETTMSLYDRQARLNNVIAEVSSIGPLTIGKARPVESLMSSLEQARIKMLDEEQQETAQFLANSGISIDQSSLNEVFKKEPIVPAKPLVIPKEFGQRDLEFWTDPSNNKFDKAFVQRTIIPKISEDKIKSFGESVNSIKTFTSDALLTTSPDRWDDMLKDMPSISKIDRWNSINPNASESEKIMGSKFLVKQRAQSIYDKAKDLYFESNPTEDRNTTTPTFDALKPYIERAKPLIGDNGNITPASAPTTPAPPGSTLAPKVNLGTPEERNKRVKIYEEMLFGNEKELLQSTISGDLPKLKKAASTLDTFNQNLASARKLTKQQLALELSKIPFEDIDFDKYVSKGIMEFFKEDARKPKRILNLVESNPERAYEIIARYNTKASGVDKKDINFALERQSSLR